MYMSLAKLIVTLTYFFAETGVDRLIVLKLIIKLLYTPYTGYDRSTPFNPPLPKPGTFLLGKSAKPL